jgi:Protein of unknown function (DUF2933)
MKIHEQPRRSGWFQSKPATWVLIAFLLIIGFFLATEHTAHFLGILPFAIFLLCPLMMFFMMRGMHGGHGDQAGHNEPHLQDGQIIEADTQKQEEPPEGGQL